MSKYIVTSKLGKADWQIDNQAREHKFIADTVDHNAGPNPVEYLCGSLNSCLSISAAMIIKKHQLDIKNYSLTTQAETKKVSPGKSVIDHIKVTMHLDTAMTDTEQKDFLSFVLHVSTVYQSIKDSIRIDVKIDNE